MAVRRRLGVLLLVVTALTAGVLAAGPVPVAGAEGAAGPSDADVQRIASQLQCPVCPGESAANSGAQLAQQMRDFIREKLAEGWTDQQILQYYVDRYGESILLNPPKRGFTSIIWLGVLAVVILGLLMAGFVLVETLRRRDAVALAAPTPRLAEGERAWYAARIERLLQGDEHG